jgi:hypothetical protein
LGAVSHGGQPQDVDSAEVSEELCFVKLIIQRFGGRDHSASKALASSTTVGDPP